RSLIRGLASLDRTNRYTLVVAPGDDASLPPLPETFKAAIYRRNDRSALDHAAFPAFLRSLSPDLVHIPLNRVPLLMMRPYVVTVHDMSSLFFEQEHSRLHMQLRRFRFRRGLARASCVIAVSEATKRDVEHHMGVPPDRIRRVYNAPDPGFLAAAAAPDAQERQRIMER